MVLIQSLPGFDNTESLGHFNTDCQVEDRFFGHMLLMASDIWLMVEFCSFERVIFFGPSGKCGISLKTIDILDTGNLHIKVDDSDSVHVTGLEANGKLVRNC